MENVHPTMQQALAGIVPPGFRSAPVMHAAQHLQAINGTLRAALKSFDAPPCPKGQYLFCHTHVELGSLQCHMEPDEEGTPRHPVRPYLRSAFLRGIDICHRLTSAEVEEIEHAALAQVLRDRSNEVCELWSCKGRMA